MDGDNSSFLPKVLYLDLDLVVGFQAMCKSSGCEFLLCLILFGEVLCLLVAFELVEFDKQHQFLDCLVDLVEVFVVRFAAKAAFVPHLSFVEFLNAEEAEGVSAA